MSSSEFSDEKHILDRNLHGNKIHLEACVVGPLTLVGTSIGKKQLAMLILNFFKFDE